MTIITSRQHAIVKTFRRVARGDDRLALLDGPHLVSDALDTAVRIDTVAIASDETSTENRRLLDRARDKGASVVEVSRAVMHAMSPVRTPAGIAALIERPAISLPQLFRPPPALIVLAIDMQDPGNVGAMIRAAEAGGATGVALAGTSADAWGWKALRAAMGSTLRMPVLQGGPHEGLLDRLRAAGVTVLASVPRGGVPMYQADMRASVAIAMGGEGAGLSHDFVRAATGSVSIPMRGRAESLNVAVAAALLVYEARRQRDSEGKR